MKDCAISVIVPVFNVEDTIRRCLDSILSQTLKNFEVLLIDDGSSDNSGKICDEYRIKDERIKVFHKQNEGVSAARQFGIDNAIGEYAIHVDPDDWIEPTELEEMYLKAIESNADMVVCDFYENNTYIRQRPISTNNLLYLKSLFQDIHGSCWNKLIKRTCYFDNNVKFPIGISFCEDLYVIASIVKNGVKITYLPKAYYHYIQYHNKTTLVHHYDASTYEKHVKLRKMFEDLLEGYPDVLEEMRVSRMLSEVRRAFYDGYAFYSSLLFFKRFNKYSHVILSHGGIKDKLFVLPACWGGYWVSHGLLNLIRHIKHILK